MPDDADTGSDSGDAPPDSMVAPPPTPCVQKWLDGTMTFTNSATLKAANGSLFTFAQERDPFLSSDELTLFFARQSASNDADVFSTSRETLDGNFATPSANMSLSDTQQDDSKIGMTGDDLTVIVASNRAGGAGGADLWQSTRASANAAFPTLDQSFLANVNTAEDQLDPHLSRDGRRLYFANGSPQQLMLAERTDATIPFDTPIAIQNIGDPSGDADPTLTGDERVIIFASNRGGAEGGSNLWYATRAERDQPFGTPIAISEVNTSDNDSDPFITADGCHLYFASTQAVGGDDFDLFFTTLE